MITISKIDFRFLLFAGVLLFLPGLEALKNIFALAFVLFWCYHANKNNDWGGQWKLIDTIFLLWVLFDVLVSLNAIIVHNLPGDNFRDIIRFVLISWVLSRTYFFSIEITRLVFISIIGTLLTLIYGYYSGYNAGYGELRELHSVGHINHTAIYLLIAYSITLSLFLLSYRNLKSYQNFFLMLSTLALLITIIDTESRAAFGMVFLVSSISCIYVIFKVKKISILILFIGLASFISIYFMQYPPKALQRILDRENIFVQDDARGQIRELSYYMFLKNPILGIGFGNHGQIKTEDVKEIVIKKKGFFDKSKFKTSAHAHNVYYTYLVGGGLLVFSIFIWFWFYIIWIVFKLASIHENQWLVLSSFNIVLINLGVGWVNTTFHHEQAILSMFVLGLLIAEYRKKQLVGL